MDLRTLTIFVKVGERRSFVRAAADLSMGQSGVSNAINRLEQELGVQLLVRTTRSVNLTDDGAAFLTKCRQIIADVNEAKLTLVESRSVPSGNLRIDLPSSFGRMKIVPLLARFHESFPKIKLTLSFTDKYVDLVGNGIDVAIRIGDLKDSDLIARRLTQYQFKVVGTPEYFAKYGKPRKLEDLKNHNCLTLVARETGESRGWRFRRGGSEFVLNPKGNMSFNDGAALAIAVRGGYGLAQIQDYYASPAIASGELEAILPTFNPKPSPISIMYQRSSHISRRVRVFSDFLLTQFKHNKKTE